MKLIFVLALCTFTSIAFASDKAGNGGDDVGIEFVSSANRAIAKLYTASDLAPSLAMAELMKVVARTKVIVVDQSLWTVESGHTQDSVAINDPSRREILINRARWLAIPNPYLKEGIALHEILSIVGLEASGLYPYSGQYLASHGLSKQDAQLAELSSLPRDSKVTFGQLAEIFNRATAPNNMSGLIGAYSGKCVDDSDQVEDKIGMVLGLFQTARSGKTFYGYNLDRIFPISYFVPPVQPGWDLIQASLDGAGHINYFADIENMNESTAGYADGSYRASGHPDLHNSLYYQTDYRVTQDGLITRISQGYLLDGVLTGEARAVKYCFWYDKTVDRSQVPAKYRLN